MSAQPRSSRPGCLGWLWRALLLAILLPLVLSAAAFGVWWLQLPPLENLTRSDTGLVVERESPGGRTFRVPVGIKNPNWVALRAISPYLVIAVVASEDDAFFQHAGFDLDQIRKSVEANLKSEKYRRGASTLTMQLARNLYLVREKTLWRKLREVYLAWRLERLLTKRRILELYLNVAEWGPGVFGAQAAARYHFGTSAGRLTLAQAALLAAILPSPIRFDPHRAPRTARSKQLYLLERLVREHKVSEAAYQNALAELEPL
jgi:monofunctional biosynthetic peptidoglycan transglycosylase